MSRAALRARLPLFAWLALVALLGACASPAPRTPAGTAGAARSVGGGYYLDDGPGAGAPADLAAIPDAVPRDEPLLARANRPYQVFGRDYLPMTRLEPYRARGVASWYGRRYHGRPTSSGEPYDMYAMTAAHPTLPLPSYVRVTHLGNGRSVVVRVNDRGPFLNNRLIDLSWTAAAKLGYVENGSAEVEVELITASSTSPAPLATGPSTGAAVAASATGATGAVGAVGAPGANPGAARSGTSDADAAPLSLAVTTVFVETSAPGAPSSTAGSGQAASASPSTTAVPATQGSFLQFGALSSVDGAQALRERIARELGWLADRLEVRAEGGLHKVLAGPWPGRDEALAVAQRVREISAFRPFTLAR